MKSIIKITDVESGEELDIVEGNCSECFYSEISSYSYPCSYCYIKRKYIFKEVKPSKKQENETT